jgi:hypothetical protein
MLTIMRDCTPGLLQPAAAFSVRSLLHSNYCAFGAIRHHVAVAISWVSVSKTSTPSCWSSS